MWNFHSCLDQVRLDLSGRSVPLCPVHDTGTRCIIRSCCALINLGCEIAVAYSCYLSSPEIYELSKQAKPRMSWEREETAPCAGDSATRVSKDPRASVRTQLQRYANRVLFRR